MSLGKSWDLPPAHFKIGLTLTLSFSLYIMDSLSTHNKLNPPANFQRNTCYTVNADKHFLVNKA